MKKFTFFHHTADAKFQAYGKTLQEAFSHSALALTHIMTDTEKVSPKIKNEIKLSSLKLESLLYDFLEQLVILLDTDGFILSRVSKMKISKKKQVYSLSATILGDNADSYDVHSYVKAITYNDMFIKETQGLVTIQVVPDL